MAVEVVCRVALVSGSLRHGSTNRAVLQTARAVAFEHVETVLYEGMARLPHFNPDNDGKADGLTRMLPNYARRWRRPTRC